MAKFVFPLQQDFDRIFRRRARLLNYSVAPFAHAGRMWVRYHAQVWNELDDLEYGGDVLKSSCDELGKCEYIPVFSGLLRVVYFVKAFSF